MQKLLESALARLTKKILEKQQPYVAAVSGSIGKTSAKEAVFCVLKEWKHAATSPKNYNNELGVPLSVIGAKAPGRNPLKWLALFGSAIRLAYFEDKNYPKCLVLEFGGDHVGDIEHLMNLATPKLGVLTAIEATHTEFYGSVEAIEKEEGKVITMLPADGVGVVNIDSAHSAASLNSARCKTISYGFGSAAKVRGTSSTWALDWDRLTASTELLVESDREVGSLEVRGVLGSHSCYALLAAIAAGKAVGISLEDCLKFLKSYQAPKGRMRAIPGIKGTIIIDDTYNSSPVACMKALDTLAALSPKSGNGKRFAVLGHMAELGAISMRSHEEVGVHLAKSGIEILVTVGEKTLDVARAARQAGMSEQCIFEFGRTEEAGRFVQERMHPGDLVLAKGSQSSRMERIVKELMADPRRAEELLVRQDPEWI
ncbi:MAG: Mur ligase family protein [bacterium]